MSTSKSKTHTKRCRKREAPRKSTKTPARRLQTVRKILRDIGESQDDLAPLKDAARIIEYVNTWKNCHTRISKLAHTIGHLRDLDDVDYADAIETYRTQQKKFFLERTEMTNSNTKSERDTRNWLDWEDIVSATATLTDAYEKAALDLYTVNPPRRTEYRTLLVVSKKEDIFMDGETNYLFTGEEDDDIRPRIILQRYKTCKTKGVYYVNNVPPSVLALAMSRGAGCYLFRHATRSQQGWSKFIADILFRTRGRRCAINGIRKSYVSHLFAGEPMSQNTMDLIASRMGTSVDMFCRAYRKIK